MPADVSVIGFDDLPDARHFLPPLTTVRQDFTALGSLALRLLLAAIDGDDTAMHELIASDTFDKAKAEAQIDKMEAQHKAMALSRLETQNKIYNILTPEQKKQFNANFEKHLTERNAPAGKMPAPAE